MGTIQKPRVRQRIIQRTEMDEKFEYLELGHMNLVPPPVGIFDEPTRCYVVNVEWAKIIMGMVSWLTTIAPWRDAQNEGYTGITEISRFMQGDNCSMFMLRQSPSDNCIIEQSLDGGESWITAFDLSLCLPAGQTEIITQTTVNNFYDTHQQFIENVYNNYVNNYINSITDIAPELGYGDSDDEFRDDALCFALTQLVRYVCEAALSYFDDVENTANDLRNSLALAAAVIGIVALAATGVGTPAAIALAAQAGLWAAGIGLGTAVGTALVDHWTETNREAYEDPQAREDVVCCLLAALEGSDVDQDDFAAAGDCPGLSTEASAILGAVNVLIQEDATYAAFVDNMRTGFNSAKLGLLPACVCEDQITYIDFNFTQGTQGWVFSNGTYDGSAISGPQINGTYDTSQLGGKPLVIGYAIHFFRESPIAGHGSNNAFMDATNTDADPDDSAFCGGGFQQNGTLEFVGRPVGAPTIDANQIGIAVGAVGTPAEKNLRLFRARVYFRDDSPITGISTNFHPTNANWMSFDW